MGLEHAYQTALAHHRAGRFPEAECLYRQILALQPDQPTTLQMLGMLAQQTNRPEQAIPILQRAIALNSRSVASYDMLGRALLQLDRRAEAAGAFRAALALQPASAHVHCLLGNALIQDQLSEAIACYRQALALKPDLQLAFENLGAALWEMGQPAEAAPCLHRARELAPDVEMVHFYLSNVLRELGQLDESIVAARRALELRPDWDQARLSLSTAMLLKGEITEAWPVFERFWRHVLRSIEYPEERYWDGSDQPGSTILLHCEHGFGDFIQLIRYAPKVAARGLRVIARCKPALCRLFETASGISQVVSTDSPLPSYDVHCSVISLPRLLGTTIQTIPAAPYLRADPVLSQQWKARLAKEPPGLKIGLAWAGSREFKEDRFRSLHLSQLTPFAGIAGVRFYSLQIGYAAAQAQSPPKGMALVDWTGDIRDFADTAALMENLDLVISSDTAVAHLAGALGQRTWVLLHHGPAWFWMLNRSDSPWYSSVQLFRQIVPNRWEQPVDQAADELRRIIAGE